MKVQATARSDVIRCARYPSPVASTAIELDAATVLLQWSVGGMFFGWWTTRHREVGLGYGWMLRITYGLMAVAACLVGLRYGAEAVRETTSALVAVATLLALSSSVVRRRAGVQGALNEHDRRSERVAAMTGIERSIDTSTYDLRRGKEFDPRWDLAPVLVGCVGLISAGLAAAGPGLWTHGVSLARVLVGALFLGAVTNAMLLGHWYLVQPGLPRRHLNDLVSALGRVWPLEVVSLLLPTGMASVLSGRIDDGWGGVLGWFWVACAATTLGLVIVTKAALRERAYSAVMAATGLLYLAILTAFGTDLVARAVLDSAS